MSKHLKEQFEEPKIIATYGKEELEGVIRPHLGFVCYNDGIGTPP
jgi:hypothetical protein